MSNSVLWAGPRLLVPVTVEALVITAENNATQFSVQPLQLGQYRHFGNINPPLFADTGFGPGTPTTQGVHINWALPDGMTQGIKQQGISNVEYPYLPNRWMIVRFSADQNVPRTAWMVESDYWFGDNPPQNRPLSSQFINADDNGDPQISVIGQVYDFDSWTENGQNSPLYLTAVGNSDPMFTAYAGNNSCVFSFTDPFTSAAATEMSYLVCGWYSNSQYDILYNEPQAGVTGWTTEQDWLDLMTRLQWSVGAESITNNTDLDNAMQAAANWLQAQDITPLAGLRGTLCAQSLCHGVVLDVAWPGDNAEPPSNVPVFDPAKPTTVPYIAAGNTSNDTMAAFMQWQLNYNNPDYDGADTNVELLLEAFSNKMLPQPGGVLDTPDLMNQIHSSWFGRLPGGTTWVVQNGQNNNSGDSQAPASLTPDLAADLALLNQLQSSYDQDCRQLASMQTQLYADWIKWSIAPTYSGVQAQLTTDLAAVNAAIVKLEADLTVLNAAQQALVTDLGSANLVLQNNPKGDFYIPNDPVLMVNNINRSYKRGEDLVYSQDNDSLFVRFTGQFINSLKVAVSSGNITVTGSQICPAFTITNQVPKEIPALLEEAYLLDIAFATTIAQIATGQTTPSQNVIDTVQQQQTLIWNAALDSSLDQRTLEQISGFNPGDELFHVPSKIGVWQWDQPWNPLFLEWEVNFYPATDLSMWAFDGSDYNWITKNTVPITTSNAYTLNGRSLLTPNEAATLEAQLREFINSFPAGRLPVDYQALNDVVIGAGDWDVLSQTIKGFSMQLLQWNIQQFGYVPTDPTYSTPMDYSPANPSQAQTIGHGMPVAMSGTQFLPVRAGFLEITRLWIVDDYGQVYNINPATGGGVPNPKQPIPGIGFEPPGYTINQQLPNYIQLPPRVVQPSRLNFDFVSATNDSVMSGQDLATSLVVGWVMPNHIDDSVALYDTNGQILGELALMGATGAQHAQWVPAPLTGVTAANITNDHLRGFVQGLLGTTSSDEGTSWSGAALTNFMQVIDETLWSVDPLGERNNQSLSILIGRPIAIVRASLQLELYGNAATDLTFVKTGQNDDGGIGDYVFDVQVGNINLAQDGVMGYFSADNYSQFNSVHSGEVATPANPAYVVNNFTPLQFQASSPSYITLLVDPRGSVHCSSGILPVLETVVPELYVKDALNNMLVEFGAGPLIMDNQTWQVPLPAGAGQKWSWLQPVLSSGDTGWTEVAGLVNQTAAATFPINSPTIREGKLKLTGVLGSQPVIYFLQVNNYTAPYTVPAGTTVQLSWASQGAAATLTIGQVSSVVVPLNSAGYSLTITVTVSVVLTVTDASGANPQATTIQITAGS